MIEFFISEISQYWRQIVKKNPKQNNNKRAHQTLSIYLFLLYYFEIVLMCLDNDRVEPEKFTLK